ncbi:MAG: carbohydrate ABC transporter permease [Clostridiales bacterium]|nr:carbohydrate ABC transporter permease [Clostridiales bacterium]
MAKKLKNKMVNKVGAEEVDALTIEKLRGWARVKAFLLSKRTRRFLWGIIRTVLLAGLCFLILYPLIIQLSTSLKSEEDLYDKTVIFIPRAANLNNYTIMWNYVKFPELFANSVLYSLLLSVLQMASCTLVAYGLARFKFKGNGIVFGLIIFTLVVPVQLITEAMKQRYMAFNPLTMFSMDGSVFSRDAAGINLTGGWAILFLMSATAVMFKNGLYIFLLRQYFRNQPKELEDAAYIDGASTFRTFWQIMLPSALPLMVTVFLFSFVWQYHDTWYLKALYPSAPVLSVSIGDAAQRYIFSTQPSGGTQNNPLISIYNAAVMIMHIIPLIVLYVFCQRFFVQSIERSGMVG